MREYIIEREGKILSRWHPSPQWNGMMDEDGNVFGCMIFNKEGAEACLVVFPDAKKLEVKPYTVYSIVEDYKNPIDNLPDPEEDFA